jgi:hypothetical protein
MYKEPEYADSRLTNTIVRWGDKPVYVQEVGGDMMCRVKTDLDSDEHHKVHLDDLSVLSPPLGFVNIGSRAVYISRKPIRRDYRQGLRIGQLVCLFGGVGDISYAVIMKCVKGDFPTLSKALSQLDDGARSVGVSRDLCVTRTSGKPSVQHCWKGKVGSVIDGKIVLLKEKMHLTYLLEKVK